MLLNDTWWISGLFAAFSLLILALFLSLKKKDPMVGCDKYRQKGCDNVWRSKCGYPNCDTLEKHRSGN